MPASCLEKGLAKHSDGCCSAAAQHYSIAAWHLVLTVVNCSS